MEGVKAENVPNDKSESPNQEIEDEMSGQLLFCGGTDWDLIGKQKSPAALHNIYQPHKFGTFLSIPVKLVASGSSSCHSVIVDETGKCWTFGRNDSGQLGHGHNNTLSTPEIVNGLSKEIIVSASCGKHHTAVTTKEGKVFTFGGNKNGQLGIGQKREATSKPVQISSLDGTKVVKVSCGAEFSVFLDSKGNVYTCGLPEYGQLGHGVTGEYFVSASKLAFDCVYTPTVIKSLLKDGVILTNIASGNNHTIAVDTEKRVWSWGFGGYGRLGHNEQKDELVPRRIADEFETQGFGAAVICCGSTCSYVVTENGQLFMFGKTKSTGEANMYPKRVVDLQGWEVQDISAGQTSTIAVADHQLVTWGPSPTYGELGYGEDQKSSTRPKLVDSLSQMHMLRVASGVAHSLIIARTKKEDLEKLEKVPIYNPEDSGEKPAKKHKTAADTTQKGGKKGKAKK